MDKLSINLVSKFFIVSFPSEFFSTFLSLAIILPTLPFVLLYTSTSVPVNLNVADAILSSV